jgi:protein subunit release factor A
MKSQHQSYKTALHILTNRVNDHFEKIKETKQNKTDRSNGERSDCRRIYTFKTNKVKDLKTKKMMQLKDFFKGNIVKLQK